MKNFNWLKSVTFVAISIPLIFLALLLAFISAGAGHGDYLFAKLFFPYSILSAITFSEITLFSLVIAFLQFPIYAFILSLAGSQKRMFQIVLLVLGLHFSAFVLCFIAPGSGF